MITAKSHQEILTNASSSKRFDQNHERTIQAVHPPICATRPASGQHVRPSPDPVEYDPAAHRLQTAELAEPAVCAGTASLVQAYARMDKGQTHVSHVTDGVIKVSQEGKPALALAYKAAQVQATFLAHTTPHSVTV